MKIKIVILVLILLCFIKNEAQTKFASKSTVSNPTLYDGTMLNLKDGTKESIQYYSYTNAADLSTKYTIIVHGIEVYDVGFKYDKEEDSISIYLFDKEQIKSEPRFVKFRSIDSHVIIKDFSLNEEPRESDRCSILFSLDSARRFITLHQFQAIGGVPTYFFLMPITTEISARHQNEVRLYRIWKEHEEAVARIKSDMLEYAYKTIEAVKKADSSIILGEPTMTADAQMHSEFHAQMALLFKDLYQNLHQFQNETFDVSFNFNCNGYGKIHVDTARSIHFNNGIPQNNWFRDSFIVRIKPLIESKQYKTLTKKFAAPLRSDFNNRLKVDSLVDREGKTFDKEIQQAYDLLSAFESRILNIPTKYSYNMKYESKVFHVAWKFLGFEDGNPKIKIMEQPAGMDLTEDLKELIKSKSLLPAKKNESDICKVFINGMLTGKDLRIIQK